MDIEKEKLLKSLLNKGFLDENDKNDLKHSLEELFEKELADKEEKLNNLLLKKELIRSGIFSNEL